jgi:hypothetical protein
VKRRQQPSNTTAPSMPTETLDPPGMSGAHAPSSSVSAMLLPLPPLATMPRRAAAPNPASGAHADPPPLVEGCS